MNPRLGVNVGGADPVVVLIVVSFFPRPQLQEQDGVAVHICCFGHSALLQAFWSEVRQRPCRQSRRASAPQHDALPKELNTICCSDCMAV